jgi:putative ABC transport system permease protein
MLVADTGAAPLTGPEMNFKESLVIALRSLRTNKLRSALTMVGIVIGVTAVIVLVGLGNGVKSGFDKTFGALATAIIIQKVQGSVAGGGAPRDLKDADVTAVREAPAMASVVPALSGGSVFRYGPANAFTGQIWGSTTEYLGVSNREITHGRMFTEQEYKTREKVTLIAPDVVKNLYNGDGQSALGTKMRIGRLDFEVIGVLKSVGDYDDIALMPLGTARSYLLGGADTITAIAAKATSPATVPAATEQINEIMDDRHNIRDISKRDDKVTALQTQLDQFNQFMFYMSAFIVAVAGISLIVGGIGVANIMLVSVTERTREIGIRKAIGAKRSAIMKQFLIESTVLSAFGGLIGVLIGVAVVLVGANVIPKVAPDFGAPEVSWVAIAVALVVSMAIGLVAGGYPAWRAARLRPIEALRYQ